MENQISNPLSVEIRYIIRLVAITSEAGVILQVIMNISKQNNVEAACNIKEVMEKFYTAILIYPGQYH